jgi:hypothetical protein
MKRKTGLLKFLLLPMIILLIFACRKEFIDSGSVKAIKLTWIPNPELRSSRMEINLDKAIADVFVDKLEESKEVEAVWLTKLILIEGTYEIAVTKKDNTVDFYQFGGDSILYSPAAKKYYQNKDLHLFIYQIIFRECIKRGIKLQ